MERTSVRLMNLLDRIGCVVGTIGRSSVVKRTTTTGDVNYPVQMAAVAIVSAPLFLVFIFLRKYIMAGVSRSGIKG